MIQLNNIVVILIALIAIGYLFSEIILQIAENGYRVGYEKGLEDGIRITNEVNEEATE